MGRDREKDIHTDRESVRGKREKDMYTDRDRKKERHREGER